MVELRKRPARAEPAAPPPSKKKAPAAPAKAKGKKGGAPTQDAPKAEEPPASNPADNPNGGLPEGAGGVSSTAEITTAEEAKETAAKVEAEAVKGKKGKAGKATDAASKPTDPASVAPAIGGTVQLEGFGSEVQTHDGKSVTLAQLVKDSKAGVVLFTYPKASTPGCTTQACLFRDAYEPLTKTGLSIYGLSTDAPKANTTFKTKQKLPYTLLCDPNATLIQAIGFKKSPKGTTRAVFAVDKNGKVLAAEAGSPAGTVDVIKALVEEMGGDSDAKGIEKAEKLAEKEEGAESKMIETTMEVADEANAAKLDGTPAR